MENGLYIRVWHESDPHFIGWHAAAGRGIGEEWRPEYWDFRSFSTRERAIESIRSESKSLELVQVQDA